RLLIAQDVYVHHFGNQTFKGLSLDARERLQENFAIFQAKWGPQVTAGYRLPPPPAVEETAPAPAGADQGQAAREAPGATAPPGTPPEGPASAPTPRPAGESRRSGRSWACSSG